MKKILLMIIYLSDLVNEAIRDLVKKYKARADSKTLSDRLVILVLPFLCTFLSVMVDFEG